MENATINVAKKGANIMSKREENLTKSLNRIKEQLKTHPTNNILTNLKEDILKKLNKIKETTESPNNDMMDLDNVSLNQEDLVNSIQEYFSHKSSINDITRILKTIPIFLQSGQNIQPAINIFKNIVLNNLTMWNLSKEQISHLNEIKKVLLNYKKINQSEFGKLIATDFPYEEFDKKLSLIKYFVTEHLNGNSEIDNNQLIEIVESIRQIVPHKIDKEEIKKLHEDNKETKKLTDEEITKLIDENNKKLPELYKIAEDITKEILVTKNLTADKHENLYRMMEVLFSNKDIADKLAGELLPIKYIDHDKKLIHPEFLENIQQMSTGKEYLAFTIKQNLKILNYNIGINNKITNHQTLESWILSNKRDVFKLLSGSGNGGESLPLKLINHNNKTIHKEFIETIKEIAGKKYLTTFFRTYPDLLAYNIGTSDGQTLLSWVLDNNPKTLDDLFNEATNNIDYTKNHIYRLYLTVKEIINDPDITRLIIENPNEFVEKIAGKYDHQHPVSLLITLLEEQTHVTKEILKSKVKDLKDATNEAKKLDLKKLSKDIENLDNDNPEKISDHQDAIEAVYKSAITALLFNDGIEGLQDLVNNKLPFLSKVQ